MGFSIADARKNISTGYLIKLTDVLLCDSALFVIFVVLIFLHFFLS